MQHFFSGALVHVAALGHIPESSAGVAGLNKGQNISPKLPQNRQKS